MLFKSLQMAAVRCSVYSGMTRSLHYSTSTVPLCQKVGQGTYREGPFPGSLIRGFIIWLYTEDSVWESSSPVILSCCLSLVRSQMRIDQKVTFGNLLRGGGRG